MLIVVACPRSSERLGCSAWRSSLIHMMVLLHCDIAAVFVMTAVPPTFFPSRKKKKRNNFSPSSPNLVSYKHLSASFTKAQTEKSNVSDLICKETESEKKQGVTLRA